MLSNHLFSMEMPNTIHNLAKEYGDPVLVTGRNLNASWKMERAVALQSNTFKNQNSDAHGTQVFYLTDNFTAQDAQLFCESLFMGYDGSIASTNMAEIYQDLFIDKLLSLTTAQCARLAEMTDEMEAPFLLHSTYKAINARLNTETAIKECLQKGSYQGRVALTLNDEAMLELAASNLKDDPSTRWFWLLKEHAINRSQDPHATITFPLEKDLYFDYLHHLSKGRIIDQVGNVWDVLTQKIMQRIAATVKNGFKIISLLVIRDIMRTGIILFPF